MNEYEEMITHFTQLEYAELISLSHQAMELLLPECKAEDPDHGGFFLLASLILTAVMADGKVDDQEHQLMADTLTLGEGGVPQFTQAYSSHMPRLTKEFFLKSDDDTRTRILMLLFAIIAVDREVCQAETDLIWDLFTP